MQQVLLGCMLVGTPKRAQASADGVLRQFNESALEYALVIHAIELQGLCAKELSILDLGLGRGLSKHHDL